MPRPSSVHRAVRLLVVHSAFLLATGCGQPASEVPEARGTPKVILIIGDGMDDQQITIARNYLVGSNGRLTLDGMPFRGTIQVQTLDEQDPSKPVYIADSANTATAIATGTLTSVGRIATTARTDRDVATIMEIAQAEGLGTGIVTTSSLTDATPASFAAHINQRLCQGPANMVGGIGPRGIQIDCSADTKANGGRGSIAEQLAASQLDVLLGGGSRYFEQHVEGSASQSVLEAAEANGFNVVSNRSELATLGAASKVLGLFSPDTMPVRLRGSDSAEAVLIKKVDGHIELPQPFSCEPNPRFEGMPTLAAMTQAALAHFDADRSFMLMVESASIDKQSHRRRPCGHIGEMGQLDETLRVALEYADAHPETLVLVTADHSHAAQLVSERGNFLALGYASPGYFARVLTPEGSIMGINYATNDSPIQEYHTGAQIPLYASGPGTEALPAFMRQAEIFGVMMRHLGLETAH
jgi:alkaline phosphatase